MRDLLDFILSPFGFLILIGILGQVFGSDKRQKRAQDEARRRRQQGHGQGPTQAGGEQRRTEAEDIARRIREMMGLEQPKPKEAPKPNPEPQPAKRTVEPLVAPKLTPPSRQLLKDEIDDGWRDADIYAQAMGAATSAVSPIFSAQSAMPDFDRTRKVRTPAMATLRRDPGLAIATLIALGPPRSLAPYEQDPLSCIHLRKA